MEIKQVTNEMREVLRMPLPSCAVSITLSTPSTIRITLHALIYFIIDFLVKEPSMTYPV